MPFAAISVPDFAVEALVRSEPELRDCALAVIEGTPPLLTVVAANERARQCGVEPGMTVLQAKERLSCVSAAQVRRRSAAQEQAAHAALLDCACAFSPRVEDTAPDTVLLDAAGLERLFGPPATMADGLARHVAGIGMQASVAVAANPDAAMHAARGFPGVTVIPPGKAAERLGELPVDVLFAAENSIPSAQETLETFDRWGIRTLRALAALPEGAVAQRLGQQGVYWQRLARGESSRPLRVMEPPLTFEEAVELDYPVALLEPLAFMLNRMLEQLCFRLGTRALAAQELHLRLQLDEAEDLEKSVASFALQGSHEGDDRETRNVKREPLFERTIRLPVPMLDAKVFLKLLQLDLQSHPPGAPVVKIWLEAEPAEPRRAQSGLFVPLTPEPAKLELTLARIAAAISRQRSVVSNSGSSDGLRVGSPEIVDTHRPDAFRMKKFNPFVTPVASRQSSVASNATCRAGPIGDPSPIAVHELCGSRSSTHPAQVEDDVGARDPSFAMRMLRPPLPVLVELRDGIPQRIRETPKEKRATFTAGEVIWAAGPWRGSGDWWTEQPWSREEWDVAVKDKDDLALYRIYRDDTGKWFVEAEYD